VVTPIAAIIGSEDDQRVLTETEFKRPHDASDATSTLSNIASAGCSAFAGTGLRSYAKRPFCCVEHMREVEKEGAFPVSFDKVDGSHY